MYLPSSLEQDPTDLLVFKVFRLFSTFFITANKALYNIWSQYYASSKVNKRLHF